MYVPLFINFCHFVVSHCRIFFRFDDILRIYSVKIITQLTFYMTRHFIMVDQTGDNYTFYRLISLKCTPIQFRATTKSMMVYTKEYRKFTDFRSIFEGHRCTFSPVNDVIDNSWSMIIMLAIHWWDDFVSKTLILQKDMSGYLPLPV